MRLPYSASFLLAPLLLAACGDSYTPVDVYMAKTPDCKTWQEGSRFDLPRGISISTTPPVTLPDGGAEFTFVEVVRLGNLKFAHYGAVSYIKEIAPKCGIKVEERMFAKGLDVMQAIIAGELDVGATASEAAISGRAGAPIYVVAGFAKGGARLVARQDSNIKSVKDLKGKKVGVTRGGIQEVLLMAELQQAGLSADPPGQGRAAGVPGLRRPEPGAAGQEHRRHDAVRAAVVAGDQQGLRHRGHQALRHADRRAGAHHGDDREVLQRARPLAEKFMRCFVQATKRLHRNRRWPRSTCAKCVQGPDHQATISTTRSAIRPTPTTSRRSTSRSPPTSWSRPASAAWPSRRWRRTGSRPTCWKRPRKA
jgi:ABC-type amino acid transport substrate-binding protein